MNIGGNMNITSQQASHHYTSENASAGMHFSTLPGKVNLTGNASRGSMRSDFDSVTSQSGIHAESDGYEITVKKNTLLKGGLIDSVANADKNRLTTGTLAWEDMKNSADYKAGGLGISYASKDEGTRLNERGLTPSISPAIRGSADSTTKSAVSEGTITITDREHQKQDISKLNRDTQNSLNQLQEIFDKTKVEEKQELVGMLEKYGNQAIHTYAESKGWKDGSTEKMLLHGAFGALMGDMAGGSAATGALSGGVNEYVMGYLTKEKGEDWVQKHPDTVQWIAAGVGTGLDSITDGASFGADIAVNSAKWNLEFSEPIHEMSDKIWETLSEEDKEKLQKSIESNSVTYGISILAKYTIRYYPQMVKEYPEIFEGVKDLGKLKSAYSIAGFIWFYCEKRYENRPDSIGYDTWLEHEIIGGQKD